jgi:hypothetical protein
MTMTREIQSDLERYGVISPVAQAKIRQLSNLDYSDDPGYEFDVELDDEDDTLENLNLNARKGGLN